VGSTHLENAKGVSYFPHSFVGCWLSCKTTVRKKGGGQRDEALSAYPKSGHTGYEVAMDQIRPYASTWSFLWHGPADVHPATPSNLDEGQQSASGRDYISAVV
jgi:hypothetical protein